MDPVTIVLVPGLLGGAVMALLVLLRGRRDADHVSLVPPSRPLPLTTDVINMASIKVAGVGGLGLVAMAVAVALDVRRIGESVALGLGLGVVIAVVMIVRRQKSGGMPSSGRGFGANTTLAIDDPSRPSQGAGAETPRLLQGALRAAATLEAAR